MAMLLFATPGFLVVKIMGAPVRVVGDFKMDAGPSELVTVPDKAQRKPHEESTVVAAIKHKDNYTKKAAHALISQATCVIAAHALLCMQRQRWQLSPLFTNEHLHISMVDLSSVHSCDWISLILLSCFHNRQ